MPEVLTENILIGRELDAAVAERVMGWQRQPDYNYWMSFPAGESFKLHKLIANWRPSESIEAAMEVVTVLVENVAAGWTVEIRSDDERTDKKWFVEFVTGDQAFLYTGEGASESLPEAICRAALAATENKK